VQPLGQEPHTEGAAELHHHGGRHVVDAHADPHDHRRQDESEHDAPCRDDQDRRDHASGRYRAGKGRGDGKAVDKERARVVEEAFALENHE
jgi:hypothetical protein